MIRVLIPTMPRDVHAIYVHLALKKKGHEGILWYPADFPIQQTHSFQLQNHNISWVSNGANFQIEKNGYDVVWYRRPGKPVLSDDLHPEDRKNAQKECGTFFESCWNIIAPNATWINIPSKAKLAESKLLQLKIASEVGLNVPNSLVSNDPQKIRNFFVQSKKEIIFKTLCFMSWAKDEEKDVRLSYARGITLNELPSDLTLKMTPGIFQEKIEKSYELRITYFGDYSVAVKLNSQEHPKGKSDWRYIPCSELTIEEYKLPESIDKKCKELMKKLGIVFGCFDFIVTPEKEYYFLEVNQSGQFLWIEVINPAIKMLDIFTEFLINKKSVFQWHKKADNLSLADFREEADELALQSTKLHIMEEI